MKRGYPALYLRKRKYRALGSIKVLAEQQAFIADVWFPLVVIMSFKSLRSSYLPRSIGYLPCFGA